jgi:myosin I
MHASGEEGADTQFLQKLQKSYSIHQHFTSNSSGFLIKHYAGDVDYSINGFFKKF